MRFIQILFIGLLGTVLVLFSILGFTYFFSENTTSLTSTNFAQKLTTSATPPTKKVVFDYEIEIPEGYSLLSETKATRTYGFGGYEYLAITTDSSTFVDLDEIKNNVCLTDMNKTCLSQGSAYGKEKDIEKMLLDNVPAQSFYITGGADRAAHIVQTTQEPMIQLKMNVAGGGLDQTFSQILDSFNFILE